MIVNNSEDFLAKLESDALPATGPSCAKAVFLVEPADFAVNLESAIDNFEILQSSGATSSLDASEFSKIHTFVFDGQI